MTRALLTAATLGTLTGLALTFGPHGAIRIAVCALAYLLWHLVWALCRDRRRYVTQDPNVWRQSVYDAAGRDWAADIGYHVYSDGGR